MAHFYLPSKKWSSVEVCVLRKMMNGGASAKEISYVLTTRSIKAIEGRMRWEKMTEAQRQNRRDGINRRRGSDARGDSSYISTSGRPTSSLLEERDRRLSISPRDLTAAFFGDPLPGYSALDRRAGQ